MTRPTPQQHTRIVVRFLLLASGLVAAGGWLAWLLLLAWPATDAVESNDRVRLPAAFHFSTAILIVVSVALHNAWSAVRVERQPQFRRWLRIAATAAVLFIGVQSFGLAGFVAELPRDAYRSSTGSGIFVFVFAVLHALHAGVATLCLGWVLAAASANRYDHEYCWGVTFCTFFWHVLGGVWLCILATFAISVGTGSS
jgi:heme/copper-type cytochrome/quinol oxidase subunit 3